MVRACAYRSCEKTFGRPAFDLASRSALSCADLCSDLALDMLVLSTEVISDAISLRKLSMMLSTM